MTIIIDDAGSGDLLFGVVIGAYRSESKEFRYDVVDVKYFQQPLFLQKTYLEQVSKTVFHLLEKLSYKDDEAISICTGSVFDQAVEDLKKAYGTERVQKAKIIGEAQYCTETAYLDEIRNLGYEPILEREEKRARSFHHMMKWLEQYPDKIIYAKTGWPRLARYRLFKSLKTEFTE